MVYCDGLSGERKVGKYRPKHGRGRGNNIITRIRRRGN